MIERPIAFSAPMVRALLDGTKTQTRRLLKAEPPPGAERVIRPFRDERLQWTATDPHDMERGQLVLGDAPSCPYGAPGDRLWVREAWRTEPRFDTWAPRDLDPTRAPIQYEAGPHADVLGGKLRPGMFMPRWASRILLEVVDVSVEKLQAISEADAAAEGARSWAAEQSTPVRDMPEARLQFMGLWEQINGPGTWEADPFVWVVHFKQVTP